MGLDGTGTGMDLVGEGTGFPTVLAGLVLEGWGLKAKGFLTGATGFLAGAGAATFFATGLALPLACGAIPFFATGLLPDECADFTGAFLVGAAFFTVVGFLADFAAFFLVAILLGFFNNKHL
jgi:hypothetical protein